MKTKNGITSSLSVLLTFIFFLLLSGCTPEEMVHPPDQSEFQTGHSQRLDIGFNDWLNIPELSVSVYPRTPGSGYIAEAKGSGIIPSGEYAGQHFQIKIEANYSAIGMETLTDGHATIKIRGDRFESVMDPLLQSFCCGEGHLQLIDGEYVFTVFGQVNHSTAVGPHNHLFAGLASTAGTMNMNIADQSDTVVELADPPHDPGIGLIIGFNAAYVHIDLP